MDEADIDLVGGGSTQSGSRGIKRPAESPSPAPPRPSKRKAGPLSRDICVRRPFSPSLSTPPSSPLPPSSPSSPVPSPPVVAELPTRPDSPVPGATPSVLYSSPAASADSEDESGPLVIAEFDVDTPAEPIPSLVNGKTPSAPMDKAPETAPSSVPPAVQTPAVDGESNSVVSSPEVPSVAPISVLRLPNGDAKGMNSKSGEVMPFHHANFFSNSLQMATWITRYLALSLYLW